VLAGIELKAEAAQNLLCAVGFGQSVETKQHGKVIKETMRQGEGETREELFIVHFRFQICHGVRRVLQ